MLFFRRYPRFTLLLSVLLIAFLLLLTRSPFPSLQPSSTPPTPTQPLNSSTALHGLASRVQRAERAYRKMLLGRDALISKVGPTPQDVALCVPHYLYLPLTLFFFFFANWSYGIRFPPDKEPWPPYTVCKSLPLMRVHERLLDDTLRGLFSTRLFLPTRAGTRGRPW
jgi:hypothetical protein